MVRYLERCQHIVTPSESIRQMLVKHSGITERITTIPTGIELKPFQGANGSQIRQQLGWQDERILVSIGRLAMEKNWKTLLSASAVAMQKNQKVRLILIGDGPQKEELKKYAQELGIAERVHFSGLIPFDQVPQYLKAADVFCFASVSETQGLVTMEAMAAGLPVVAVKATGTEEIVVAGKTGLLTKNDSQALAQAITQVLDDNTLFNHLKSATLEKAQSFSIAKQAQKMVDVYEQAIEDKKANKFIKINMTALNESKRQFIPSD